MTPFTLPTCLIKLILLFINLLSFFDFSGKINHNISLGVIFNSALVDLMFEISSIKLFISI